MTKHLYIIGNGFDLHHKVNSSYKEFADWLQYEDCELMGVINELYVSCTSEWWSDFENNLASLDAVNYAAKVAFENQPDLLSEHCDGMWGDAAYEADKQLADFFSSLKDCFHDWIMQLRKPLESQKIKFVDRSSLFISFNYTKTLEDLYGINRDNILYIHGCISRDENFIIGHGKNYKDIEEMNKSVSIKPSGNLLVNENEEGDDGRMYHHQLAEEAAYSAVAGMRKPVDEIIERKKDFFCSLSAISHIHVYGMSLSKVDLPYFRHILSINSFAVWEFSDYCGYNKEKIERFCEENNIRNYTIIELNDIIDKSQKEIDFPL